MIRVNLIKENNMYMHCNCRSLADFKCSCGIFICSKHLDGHKATRRYHEIVDIQTYEIKAELKMRIHGIRLFKNKIFTILENSTAETRIFAEPALDKLDILEKNYLNLMNSYSFEGVITKEIKELHSTILEFKTIELDLENNISEIFSNLYTLKIKPINDWTLFQKAEELRRIIDVQIFYIDELKFSNDLKYAFKCEI